MSPTLLRALVLTIAFAGLLSWVHTQTRDRIAMEQLHFEQSQLASVLPATSYDAPLKRATFSLPMTNSDHPSPVYLAYQGGQPKAALIEITTSKGYSGDIKLLLAVSVEGVVLGVRVLEHKETPGLGDAIEHTKSDWLNQFVGQERALGTHRRWRADRLGGDFDTLSSATITSSAVIEAIALGLDAYTIYRDQIWSSANE